MPAPRKHTPRLPAQGAARCALHTRLWPLAVLLPLLLCRPAQAALEPVPQADLVSLAPVLRGADLLLLQLDVRGRPAQLTIAALCAAAPEDVRQVVLHPERYRDRVQRLRQSSVSRLADGSLEHRWRLAYLIGSESAAERLQRAPDGSVEISPLDGTDGAGRWDFVQAPGGGTVLTLAMEGSPHLAGGLERLGRGPAMETALAALARLALVQGVRAQADSGARQAEPLAEGGGALAYEKLLQRGDVVLVPWQGDPAHASLLSLIGRVRSRPESVLEVLQQPAQWPSCVAGITRGMEVVRQDGIEAAELEWTLPLLTWRTEYAVQTGGQAVDLLGLSGDLRGGRLRFDVRQATGPDAAGQSDLVLRARQPYERTSVLLRQLYSEEPLFERAINLGVGLGLLRGLRARAELNQGMVSPP